MNRKKELKELYKNMKPSMGVYIIKSNVKNKCLLDYTQNLKSKINGIKFQLNAASNNLNMELQNDWKEMGEKSFTIEILEKLEYDKDESKVDYTEELKMIKLIWEEKLSNEGIEFYN